jgi:hypothetical protein
VPCFPTRPRWQGLHCLKGPRNTHPSWTTPCQSSWLSMKGVPTGGAPGSFPRKTLSLKSRSFRNGCLKIMTHLMSQYPLTEKLKIFRYLLKVVVHSLCYNIYSKRIILISAM